MKKETNDERVARGLEWLDGERDELEKARGEGQKDHSDYGSLSFEEGYYLGAKHMLHAMLGDGRDVKYDETVSRHRIV